MAKDESTASELVTTGRFSYQWPPEVEVQAEVQAEGASAVRQFTVNVVALTPAKYDEYSLRTPLSAPWPSDSAPHESTTKALLMHSYPSNTAAPSLTRWLHEYNDAACDSQTEAKTRAQMRDRIPSVMMGREGP